MLDPIQYEFRFFQNTLVDPEPEPKLRYSGSGSSQKFQLHAAPAPQHCISEHLEVEYPKSERSARSLEILRS
jgi:hypothetical protein